MKRTSRTRTIRSRFWLSNTLVALMLLAGQAISAAPVTAADGPVDVVGQVTEQRIDTEGGCEKWTLLLWADLPGAVSYTIDMHDTLGYSFVATFPPYQYDAAFGGLPAVGAGQHRHALTYQGGGVGGCQADDVSRYTILSFVANYDNNDGRIVGAVTDSDGAAIAGVPVAISGASASTQTTNSAGAYGASVRKGNYTVSAPAGYCVRGGTTCSRSKSLNVQGPTSVNFVKSSGKGTISGLVTERTCREDSCSEAALPGVLVSAAGPEGGEQVTGADGRYSITVGTGEYQVTPALDDREFDPPSSTVTVNDGDSIQADFATCAVTLPSVTADDDAIACKPLRIDWTMPDRIKAAGWNETDRASAYVNPKGGWKVNLFLKDAAGAATTCTRGHVWTWTVKPRGTDVGETYKNKQCKFSPKVPREGVYTVSVEERNKADDKLIARGTHDVVVQDFLLIGLGDSNGSGQGNPPYEDRQCDRGVDSYQFRAAEFVENQDPRTSVTFVHLSCSGARTVHIAEDRYVGQEPNGSLIPPQLVQLRKILSRGNPVREIDAMILSAGINDVRFGGIVAICLQNKLDIPCQDRVVKRVTDGNGEPTLVVTKGSSTGDGLMKSVVADEIANLPALYAQMSASMSSLVTIDPQRVLMTTYPDESWRAPGVLCDDTSGPRPRLTSSEWGWLAEAGDALNDAVAHGPFKAITAIPDLFIGHGYCTSPGDNWFRSVLRSLQGQYNPYGTFHATRNGHQAMSVAVTDVLCPQLFTNGSINCLGLAREPGTGSLP